MAVINKNIYRSLTSLLHNSKFHRSSEFLRSLSCKYSWYWLSQRHTILIPCLSNPLFIFCLQLFTSQGIDINSSCKHLWFTYIKTPRIGKITDLLLERLKKGWVRNTLEHCSWPETMKLNLAIRFSVPHNKMEYLSWVKSSADTLSLI